VCVLLTYCALTNAAAAAAAQQDDSKTDADALDVKHHDASSLLDVDADTLKAKERCVHNTVCH
jgi:hypothetical protein